MQASRTNRVHSIDILRGLVMIIMALDHTRDYFHITAMTGNPLDPDTTTPALYLTRWITHFCAPTFVFLSGISAYIASLKKSKNEASLFMIKRGLWLVIAELIIVTFGITFNPFFNVFILQVIWAIGCSMILLGLLSRISTTVVLIVGIILFFGHNIINHLDLPTQGTTGRLIDVFIRTGNPFIPLSEDHMAASLYAILPWTGVMLMGYSIGRWFHADFPAEKRRKWLMISGIFLLCLFIILRFTGVYGNPGQWVRFDDGIKNIMSFMNVSKYPPSLQYLGMTLGPALIVLSLLEHVKAKWTQFASVYGQVPFFYYILHFYILHILCVIAFYASGFGSADIRAQGFPPVWFRPFEWGYNLWITYAIWIAVVLGLYYPCRWFAKYKKTHNQWWLRYL
jgi:uncharacterized membrane protein